MESIKTVVKEYSTGDRYTEVFEVVSELPEVGEEIGCNEVYVAEDIEELSWEGGHLHNNNEATNYSYYKITVFNKSEYEATDEDDREYKSDFIGYWYQAIEIEEEA